jgi:transposase
MELIILSDEKLSECYTLMKSIQGVGKIISCYMLVHTQAFTGFDNWRQFASYCGIAPYPNQSGLFKGRTTVSHLANKKLKSLFHLIAMGATQTNPEMKGYYERRIAEGKTKMSSLNMVRNKMLSRIFAVVKRGTPYKHLTLTAA